MLLIVRSILLSLFIIFIVAVNASVTHGEMDNSILFYDDFTNNLDRWRIKYGNWYIDQDSLVNKRYGVIDQPSRIETGEENWENFRLELDLNNIDGIDSGIGFRRNNTTNSNYELTIRHGSGEHGPGETSTPQIFLQKVYWNQPYVSIKSSTVLADNRSFPLIHNIRYHITIEVFKNNIKVWVNNNKLFDITDNNDDIKSGFITLATWTGKLGKIYVTFDNVKVTSLIPIPFLDLPWDYKAQGSTFNYMALNPYSWFDHQYPLQNQCPPCNPPVMNYMGQTINSPYRTHNGYDYSRKNGIILNTPVLAAASGSATFKPWNKTAGAGNVIKINHGNGYQTWYEHLSKDGLVVSTEGQEVHVEQRQQIGLVGMTGTTYGPHIHFSVFKDSNNNSSFSDDYPYGVTDPLGWEGEDVDPWSIWSNGTRSGTTSYNLFLPASPYKSVNIPLGGGTLTTDDTIIFAPPGTLNNPFTIVYKIGSFESLSDYKTGVTPSFSLNAYMNGQPVTQFLKPITITVNYSKANLTNINENTIKFSFFNEQTQSWQELPTTVNTISKTISTTVNRLTHFAVMGEAKDLTLPTTTVDITGDEGENGWYRTPVTVELQGQDNEGGIGLEYTLYSLNGNDWFEYTEPLVFDTEGDYQIIYQSYDKTENQEPRQTLNFHIDKTPPQVSLGVSPQILWPPDGKMVDVTVTGNSSDDYLKSNKIIVEDEYDLIEPLISNFGQTIQLEAKRNGNNKDGRTYIIEATATDLAGNTATKQTQILVPHDQRSKN